ncbi:hypothetical protein [Exiguobacterium undae]|uniref:hypothetical protein n=1 Tax=Exiguobacterium undae TaxID=169177 RepID=UPI00384E4588
MIELEINPKTLKQHKEWICTTNKNVEKRLYKKLENLSSSEVDPDKKRIFKFLFSELPNILIDDLLSLKEIINRYESLMVDFRLKDTEKIKKVRGRSKYNGKKERILLNDLKIIFENEYKHFYSAKEWNAYMFLEELNLSICPYCGSQFIFLYNNGKKTRATLDHFFDKATYPFLAISIFNLVPSCKVCNSDLKSTKEFTLDNNYSPYEKNIVDKIEFSIDVESVKKGMKIRNENSEIDYYDMFIGGSTDFKIKVNYNENDKKIAKKIKGNLETFKLEEFYNKYHKQYVKSIIRKSHIYNKVYIQALNKSFDLIFIDENDLLKSIYSSVEEDKNNILGKLNREIAKKQLSLLNS